MGSLPKATVEYEIVSKTVFGEEVEGRRICSHYQSVVGPDLGRAFQFLKREKF